jgi:hypothetical protein
MASNGQCLREPGVGNERGAQKLVVVREGIVGRETWAEEGVWIFPEWTCTWWLGPRSASTLSCDCR